VLSVLFLLLQQRVENRKVREFRNIFEGNRPSQERARKGKRVLRVFVDCKINGYPDLMQPLRKGIRKETVEENPGTRTAREPGMGVRRKHL
jgi:hypothetical protein